MLFWRRLSGPWMWIACEQNTGVRLRTLQKRSAYRQKSVFWNQVKAVVCLLDQQKPVMVLKSTRNNHKNSAILMRKYGIIFISCMCQECCQWIEKENVVSFSSEMWRKNMFINRVGEGFRASCFSDFVVKRAEDYLVGKWKHSLVHVWIVLNYVTCHFNSDCEKNVRNSSDFQLSFWVTRCINNRISLCWKDVLGY